MALTNTEKSKAFRAKNKELGRTELRGVWATDAEKPELKKLISEKLAELRKDS